MATIGDVLKETVRSKPEVPAGAVADTWLLSGVATRNPHALLAAYWLQQQQVWVRVTGEAKAEYERFYETSPPILDDDGVPKGPVNMERILDKARPPHIAARGFGPEDQKLLENTKLSKTDKGIALEAKVLARNFGQCYVVTNDTEIIRQVRQMVMEQGLNITLVMPSYIEQHLASMLPELGLGLIIPTTIVAELCRIGRGEQQLAGNAYVHVNRKAPYRFIDTTITIDAATEVCTTDKRTPARTNDYGIPFTTVKSLGQEDVNEAFTRLRPQIPKGPRRFILLPEDEKYFPAVLKLAEDRHSFYFQKVNFARTK